MPLDPEMTTGQRIKHFRERAGLSRPVLAGLVGRSAEWVKAVETGRLGPPRLPLLVRLAEVLGVRDLAELTGDQSMPVGAFTRGRHPAIEPIRAVIARYRLSPIGASPIPLGMLRSRIDAAWRDWHTVTNRRTVVGTVLPGILADGEHTAAVLDGQARRAAHALLADAYHLTQHVLVNAAEPEMLWLVVERGMTAARIADEPYALAGAAWTVGNMLRVSGRMDEALALAGEAADLLEPYLAQAGDDWRGMWGALALHRAVTAARAGRDGDAWRYWERAQRVARHLPPGYHHPWTVFSQGNVDLHAVSLTMDLWRSREALRRAAAIRPEAIRSRERRGRLLVELARGHHATGDRRQALAHLDHACELGVDSVRWSPAARGILDDLKGHPPTGMRREVRALARRVEAADD